MVYGRIWLFICCSPLTPICIWCELRWVHGAWVFTATYGTNHSLVVAPMQFYRNSLADCVCVVSCRNEQWWNKILYRKKRIFIHVLFRLCRVVTKVRFVLPQMPVVSTGMSLMQPVMRPAMTLASQQQFAAHMMRPGHPVGLPPGTYSSLQLNQSH